MGGAISQGATEERRLVQDNRHDGGDDPESTDETVQHGDHGVWDHIRQLGDQYLFRRRQGADLYDDGKSSHFFSNSDGSVSRSVYNDINKRHTDGQTPLTKALRSEDNDNLMKNVEHLLEVPGIDINYCELQQSSLYSYTEVPPLTVAIRRENKHLVGFLLDSGANVNQIDSNQISPLGHAVESGDVGIVSLLLNYKPSLSSVDYKEDPLHAACRQGHQEIVRLLVQAGADINPSKQSSVTSPFDLAVQNKHEDICIYLLDILASHNVNVNEVNSLRNEAFIRACWFGCPKVVQYLIRHGANVNTRRQGIPATVHSLRSGDIARFNRHQRVARGEERLQLISDLRTTLTESYEIVSLLCENGAELETKMEVQELTALCSCLKAANIPVVFLLLKHGAIWNANCTAQFERNHFGRLCSRYPNLSKQFCQFLNHKQRRQCMERGSTADEVRTLQDCCRHVIRSCVCCHGNSSISILPLLRSLPLPFRVLDFLCYSEIEGSFTEFLDMTIALLHTY